MKIQIMPNKLLVINEKIPTTQYISAYELEKKSLFSLKLKIKKLQSLTVFLDLSQITNLRKVLKKYFYLYTFSSKNNLTIGCLTNKSTVLAYIQGDDEDTLSKIKEFFYVLLIDDIKERYTYIYDKACDELDEVFRTKNICDFQNDRCINQRMNKTPHDTMGCCYSFYYRKDGYPVDSGLCKYLDGKSCSIKCLKCKMFTCDFLKKQGIKFLSKDFWLLDIFLNSKQIKFMESAFFTPENDIIDKWIKIS